MKAASLRPILASMFLAASALAALPGLAQSAMTDAEVRKVDKENQKITLKHGEIKNLDMPPMTMVFAVKDAAMLDKVKAGDKVQFSAANDNGKLTVTEIQAVK
jgi:Cu/Ag efflux protein CusF